MPKRYHLEAPTINEQPAETPTVEFLESAEIEPLRESVDTVRQLMDAWKNEYDQTEDQKRKAELGYRMVRMAEAVQAAHLSPDEVKIREAEPGVLGFYMPDTGEIAITTAGLELSPEHFKDVLVHEATHAGEMNVYRISDEGLTQLHVERVVSGAMPDIYPQEKRQAEDTFSNVGIQRVLETYNFDKPRELIDLYLQVEWDDEWKNKWQEQLAGDPETETEAGRIKILEGAMKEWLEKLEENFEAAAPRLVTKAESEGFDFSATHEREFARVLKEAQGRE